MSLTLSAEPILMGEKVLEISDPTFVVGVSLPMLMQGMLRNAKA